MVNHEVSATFKTTIIKKEINNKDDPTQNNTAGGCMEFRAEGGAPRSCDDRLTQDLIERYDAMSKEQQAEFAEHLDRLIAQKKTKARISARLAAPSCQESFG